MRAGLENVVTWNGLPCASPRSRSNFRPHASLKTAAAGNEIDELAVGRPPRVVVPLFQSVFGNQRTALCSVGQKSKLSTR